jgi:hypothetical protein
VAAARPGQQERQATVPDRLGALLALGALAAALAACQPAPGAFGKEDAGRQPAVVRIVRSSGEEREQTSSIAPGDQTSTPTATGTATATPTRSPTPTITLTPTPRPPATRTPSATPTVTPTPTPRGQAPDLAAAMAGFQRQERYRLRVSGGGPEVLWEIAGRDNARVVVYEPARVTELVVRGGEVFIRSGSFWLRALDPPAQVTARPDRLVAQLGRLGGRPFRLLGQARARAGRCEDWDLTDNGPAEPISICLGEADRLPYRVVMPGGLTIEPFDFGAALEVPPPSPLRSE